MQNDKYTDFDLELKRMLGDAEEEVPSRIWDAVSGELDRRDRRKVVALRWRRAAAWTAAAAAVLSGIFVFTGRDDTREPDFTAAVTEEVRKADVPVTEDIPAIEEQIAASSGAALASVPEPAVRRPDARASVPSAVTPADTFVPEEAAAEEIPVTPVTEEAAVAEEVPVQAAEPPGPQEFHVLVFFRYPGCGNKTRCGMQVQLSDLLFQRHPGHQLIDIAVHLGPGGAGGQQKRGGQGQGSAFGDHDAKIIQLKNRWNDDYSYL